MSFLRTGGRWRSRWLSRWDRSLLSSILSDFHFSILCFHIINPFIRSSGRSFYFLFSMSWSIFTRLSICPFASADKAWYIWQVSFSVADGVMILPLMVPVLIVPFMVLLLMVPVVAVLLLSPVTVVFMRGSIKSDLLILKYRDNNSILSIRGYLLHLNHSPRVL